MCRDISAAFLALCHSWGCATMRVFDCICIMLSCKILRRLTACFTYQHSHTHGIALHLFCSFVYIFIYTYMCVYMYICFCMHCLASFSNLCRRACLYLTLHLAAVFATVTVLAALLCSVSLSLKCVNF